MAARRSLFRKPSSSLDSLDSQPVEAHTPVAHSSSSTVSSSGSSLCSTRLSLHEPNYQQEDLCFGDLLLGGLTGGPEDVWLTATVQALQFDRHLQVLVGRALPVLWLGLKQHLDATLPPAGRKYLQTQGCASLHDFHRLVASTESWTAYRLMTAANAFGQTFSPPLPNMFWVDVPLLPAAAAPTAPAAAKALQRGGCGGEGDVAMAAHYVLATLQRQPAGRSRWADIQNTATAMAQAGLRLGVAEEAAATQQMDARIAGPRSLSSSEGSSEQGGEGFGALSCHVVCRVSSEASKHDQSPPVASSTGLFAI